MLISLLSTCLHYFSSNLPRGKIHFIAVFFSSVFIICSGKVFATDALNVGLFFKHASLDPIYGTTVGDVYVINAIHENLAILQYGKQEPAPGLALAWEVSADGLVYTFTLRPNIRWSDGKPILAQDFVTTYRRIHNPELNAFSKPLYLAQFIANSKAIAEGKKSIEALGVRALNDKTLQVTLENPVPFFPPTFSEASFSPSPTHLIEQFGEDWATLENIAVSGPYLPKTAPTNEVFPLKANAYYHDAENIHHKVVRLNYLTSLNAASADLLNGTLDLIQQVDQDQLDDVTLLEDSPVTIIPGIAKATFYIAFNLQDPKIQNVQVRKALSFSMNRERMHDELQLKPAYSFASPSVGSDWEALCHNWCQLSEADKIKKAQALMRMAGYSPFKRLKLTFSLNESDLNKRVAQLLKEAWARIWVDIKLDISPGRDHYIKLRKKKYQVARASWTSDYNNPLSFLQILHPKSTKNYAGWKNKKYGELLDILSKKYTNQEKSFDIYRSLERLIDKENPIAPLIYARSEVSLLSERYKKPKKGHTMTPLFIHLEKK